MEPDFKTLWCQGKVLELDTQEWVLAAMTYFHTESLEIFFNVFYDQKNM